MKLSEFLQKNFGVDLNKEYESPSAEELLKQSLAGKQQEHEQQQEEHKEEHKEEPKVDESLAAKLAEQEKQIAELKAANQKLLNQTPADKEPTFAESLLSLVGKGGYYNGNSSTGNGHIE